MYMFCVLVTSNRHSQLIFDAKYQRSEAQIICAPERKKITLKLMLYSLSNARTCIWSLKKINKNYKIRSDTVECDVAVSDKANIA